MSQSSKRTRRNWVRLDNASKIFLASITDIDKKVFRISAELMEEVDPETLQEALDLCYDDFPLYHNVIRRGIFWYYMEESDLRPQLQEESELPCSAIYHFDKRQLLFRVLYWQKRIHLEVFHSLSDGNGAMNFLSGLLGHYFRLKAERDGRGLEEAQDAQEQVLITGDLSERQMDDGFTRFYSTRRSFSAAFFPPKLKGVLPSEVYHFKGEKTADRRPNIVECECAVAPLLSLARAEKVSLTAYISALFFMAAHREVPRQNQDLPLTMSVPVDLRRFYPTRSMRNFFATMTLVARIEEGQTVADLARNLQTQLNAGTRPEILETKIRQQLSYEKNPILRPIPRPLKDLILRWINHRNNRRMSLAMTNLGRSDFGVNAGAVRNIIITLTVARPQLAAITHGEKLSLTILSPYKDRRIALNFADILRELGIEPSLCGNPLPEEIRKEKTAKKNKAPVTTEIDPAFKRPAWATKDSPYPNVPLRFKGHTALRILSFISIVTTLVTMLEQHFWPSPFNWAAPLLFGQISLWAVVITIIRKRRNIAKGTVYVISLLILLSLFWDHYYGWTGWSINLAIPIICSFALIALFVTVRIVKLALSDYLVYLSLAAFLGLIPGLFLYLDFLYLRFPAFISLALSLSLLSAILIFRWRELRDEISKRLHL